MLRILLTRLVKFVASQTPPLPCTQVAVAKAGDEQAAGQGWPYAWFVSINGLVQVGDRLVTAKFETTASRAPSCTAFSDVPIQRTAIMISKIKKVSSRNGPMIATNSTVAPAPSSLMKLPMRRARMVNFRGNGLDRRQRAYSSY